MRFLIDTDRTEITVDDRRLPISLLVGLRPTPPGRLVEVTADPLGGPPSLGLLSFRARQETGPAAAEAPSRAGPVHAAAEWLPIIAVRAEDGVLSLDGMLIGFSLLEILAAGKGGTLFQIASGEHPALREPVLGGTVWSPDAFRRPQS